MKGNLNEIEPGVLDWLLTLSIIVAAAFQLQVVPFLEA
jgi:hypothetical protein